MVIIPKPSKEIPTWQNILFYLCLLILIGSLASYFVLNHFQSQASTILADLEIRIAKQKTPQEKKLEEEISQSQKKVEDFSKLIEAHRKSSNFFPFFKSLIHPQVQITELDLNLNTSEAVLRGVTTDFQTLGQQFYIFQAEPKILKTDLSNISIEKKIGFNFKLSLKEDIFK